MSTAAVEAPVAIRGDRPRLVVIHGDALDTAATAPTAPPTAPATAYQQELPLTWPLDPRGEAASSVLGRYPALPLDPAVPRPEPYVAHLAQILADVLVGARPVSHLSRHVMLDVQQELTRRRALRQPSGSWSGSAARVTSTSTMVVSGTAAQVVIVFFAGRSAHAAAVRMEYRHRRWLVTDVQMPG